MNTLTQRLTLSAARAALFTLGGLMLAAFLILVLPTLARAAPQASKPTVVLVHGAFAESSSWETVVARLQAKGYRVVAAANPLRGVRNDATYVANLLDSISGPVVLVGHSYGGTVITNAATGKMNVKALIYVSGFAPDEGEASFALNDKFPGATLGAALAPPVILADGEKDLYIQPAKYHAQFAADIPARIATMLAATQRPSAESAGSEPSGPPAWKNIPSWFIYGTADLNIPPALQPFMADRAGAKRIVAVKGASHVVMVSHPDLVANLIVEAANATRN